MLVKSWNTITSFKRGVGWGGKPKFTCTWQTLYFLKILLSNVGSFHEIYDVIVFMAFHLTKSINIPQQDVNQQIIDQLIQLEYTCFSGSYIKTSRA